MRQKNGEEVIHTDVLQMTTQVVAAYVENNSIEQDQISEVIKSVYTSLAKLNGHTATAAEAKQKPAVPVKKSVTPDYVICLEDGKKFKMLKRHLRTAYGLSPEEYRAKWGLASDYPMVAPNYAKQRSAYAKKIGLGKKSRRPNKG
jgi:predicted transcriptional regulator